jgi:hypothetical protein
MIQSVTLESHHWARVEMSELLLRRAIGLYDKIYRSIHRLDTPASTVGPAFCVGVRRCFRRHQLSDGTNVRPSDLIGVLHLNNARVAALHIDRLSSMAVGLEFRRQVLASLRSLAAEASPGGRLATLQAFTATTIFHTGLRRLGFEVERGGVAWPGLVAAYQRALLASMHPARSRQLRRSRYDRACRLWLSRRRLLERYGRLIQAAA